MKTISTIFLALFPSFSLFSQIPLTTSNNFLRHGDIICKIEVSYVSEGERGCDAVWHLSEIPDDGKECFQVINSNIDTVAIYEEGRILHYFAHSDTLTFKGQQSPRAYKIYSQERPYIRYPFQYGDSISGCYKGDCREENEFFPVEGFGYTVADGMGCLTDGEDTLKHVTRVHLSDEYVYNYTDGTRDHLVEDRYMWYCAGYRYAVMESMRTLRHEKDKLVPVDSISYLYLPYMQLGLAEDEANEQLLAELAAAREALSIGNGMGSVSYIEAALSTDGRTITISYQLSNSSDISFYASDITGSILGSVRYQNREAGEWQECLVLTHKPIGNALLLRIDSGTQTLSLKVTKE